MKVDLSELPNSNNYSTALIRRYAEEQKQSETYKNRRTTVAKV